MKQGEPASIRAGAEIRTWREAAGLSQQSLADLFQWNRDAVSKIETGKNNISLHDYLTLARFLEKFVPADHPALALGDKLIPRRIRRPRTVS